MLRCAQAVPETVERYRDWAVAEGHDLEAIIAEAAPEAALAGEAMADALGELRAAAGVTIHRSDGAAMLGRFDGVATIVPVDVPVDLLAHLRLEARGVGRLHCSRLESEDR